MAFGYEYDWALQNALKNRRDASGLMTINGIAEIIEDIDAKYAEETGRTEEKEDSGELPVVPGSGQAVESDGLDVAVQVLIAKAPTDFDCEKMTKLEKYRDLARTKVTCHVDLVPETGSDLELITAIKNSDAFKATCDASTGKHVGIFYDTKLVGQASAHPHLRTPPLRQNGEHLRRLIGIFMQARGEGVIADTDLYFLFDGGKPGWTRDWAYPFEPCSGGLCSFVPGWGTA